MRRPEISLNRQFCHREQESPTGGHFGLLRCKAGGITQKASPWSLRWFQKCLLLIILLWGVMFSAVAQQTTLPQRYRQSSVHSGLGIVRYQDRATSPLVYSGLYLNMGLGQHFIRPNRETSVQLSLGGGAAISNATAQALNNVNSSYLLNGQFGLGYLHKLPFYMGEAWKTMLGARLDGFGDLRINRSHNNNALGYDVIANFMLSGKIQYDWHRVTKKRARNKTHQFYMQVNAGLLNFNYRPGYNYKNSTVTTGDDYGEQTKDPVASYKLKMNGYRYQVEVGVVNSVFFGYNTKIAFEWDGMYAPGRFEPFGLTIHQLKYTLYLNKFRR